jgi:hypothetical protein
VLQAGEGYFIQIEPGSHTNGEGDPNNIIESHARGVINVVGKPAGIYEYVFVSTSDNFCGMTYGKQSIVRVYLVPQPTGFPVLTNVCPGKTESINFDNFIPPEILYFIKEVGWTITYTLNGRTVDMPVETGLSNVGNTEYRYTFNDSRGPFAEVYSGMKNSPYFCPEDSASLTHTVRIRDGEEYTIPNKSISFCTDALRLVPETSTILNTNLFGYLGSSAPNGEWSIESSDVINPSELQINRTTGDVSIPIGTIASFQGIGTPDINIVFKYSYKNCAATDADAFNTFTLLTFDFDKSDFTSTFNGVQGPHDVCRNLMSGVVELSSIFGFTAPLTSGVWFRKEGNEFNEMLYGAVDITQMKSGSLYTFRYDVSSAVDALCMAEGSSTVFEIRMRDLENSNAANAAVNICKQQFKEGMTIDLSRYVPGLNDTNRIDPAKVIWRDTVGVQINNPTAYRLQSNAEWQTSDTSTYRMQLKYEVQSDCGPYSGNLIISTVDSIGTDTIRNVLICYTDDYAKHVDLFQLLGIVVDNNTNNNGSFILFSAVAVNGNQTTIFYPDLGDIETTGIMNAYEIYNDHKIQNGGRGNAREEYTFRYLPVPGRTGCIPSNMQITIVVTEYVEDNSDFK